jgi:X-X-X-Leu-X-X-Gly heptad repeat protein
MDKLNKPGLMNRSANVYLSNLIDKVNELVDKVNELNDKTNELIDRANEHEQALVSSKTSSKASGRSKRGTVRQPE